MTPVHIIWFKRDLSIHDNAALSLAARSGPVVPLYIMEPDLWAQPDVSYRQYDFLYHSLRDLNADLSRLGAPLVVRVGDAVTVLEAMRQSHPIAGIYSHQETWNMWTYARDIRVLDWCKHHNITWHEPVRNGVVRRLKSRDGWARSWHDTMSAALIEPPTSLSGPALRSDKMPKAADLGLDTTQPTTQQMAGRQAALDTLGSFLTHRGRRYRYEMSSPRTADHSCSRLSAYLAFGTLSIREVAHATTQARRHIRDTDPHHAKSIDSFYSRLHWHCHFMQKLEDQPNIETTNLHPAFRGLDRYGPDHPHFTAWATGRTGYPFIDACMRYLNETGWLNFRMRAMLVSFASYHLWLDWRATSQHLARQFLDYEPGIHYSQVQMQSGTTGINTIRIYNPIKQSQDQDPKGQFIRKWVPELAQVRDEHIHEPWLYPDFPDSYILPIVDEKQARTAAAQKIHAIKKAYQNDPSTKSILVRHASRNSPDRRPAKSKKQTSDPRQLDLF